MKKCNTVILTFLLSVSAFAGIESIEYKQPNNRFQRAYTEIVASGGSARFFRDLLSGTNEANCKEEGETLTCKITTLAIASRVANEIQFTGSADKYDKVMSTIPDFIRGTFLEEQQIVSANFTYTSCSGYRCASRIKSFRIFINDDDLDLYY